MLDLRRDSGLQGGISGFQSLGCLARSLMFSGGHCREGDLGSTEGSICSKPKLRGEPSQPRSSKLPIPVGESLSGPFHCPPGFSPAPGHTQPLPPGTCGIQKTSGTLAPETPSLTGPVRCPHLPPVGGPGENAAGCSKPATGKAPLIPSALGLSLGPRPQPCHQALTLEDSRKRM